MNDNKHPYSAEFLDDEKPEKNKRSFFDWLRGEDGEKERLRKKLDKELKEAARKRAQEAEEEARTAENRETAETKKLKKKWRKRLFQQSQRRLEEATNERDDTQDGYQLAQDMVAERIVWLYTTLEEEPLRKPERKALKIQLDFMGLLSEKLSRPEIEVPEEVETLWRTIAETSQVPPEKPDRFAPNGPSPQPETPHTPPEHTRKPESAKNSRPSDVFLAAIVAVMKRAMDTSPPSPRSSAPTHQGASIPTPYSVETSTPPATHTTTPLRPPETRQTKEGISDQPKSRLPQLQPSELRGKPTEQPSEKRSSSILVRRTAEAIQRDPDLEELSTAELLEKARPLALGAGQYLGHAFLTGEIDREGMIKVLKAHKKGLDYRSEFSRRHEAYRRARAGSPEYLPPSPATPTTPPRPLGVTEKDDASFNESPEPAPTTEQQSPITATATLPDAVLAAEPSRSLSHVDHLKKQATLWLLAGSVTLVLLLCVVVAVVFWM